MSLEVKLFNPRRSVCEAVKITNDNLRLVRNWAASDEEIKAHLHTGAIGKWIIRRSDNKFDLMTEGQLWGLYEPILH
uniref:Uncharacterized protein n=1 Tax=Siphoviridae sp. ctMeu2 TaxID=2826262 RepID=A0A8S5LZ66_9CAUD|nr:MAG TPA: hypothetical protein [Siphoviridae sp. ctMeu2]